MKKYRRMILNFSPQSLSRRRREYVQVRKALMDAARSPNCPREDRAVINDIVRQMHPFNPPQALGVVLYPHEWDVMSKALRDWDAKRQDCPPAYQYAIRARQRCEWTDVIIEDHPVDPRKLHSV